MRLSGLTLKAILLCLLCQSNHVGAHSWVEQLTGLATDGSMTGQPGFPRGNVLRTDPGFGDSKMVFLIPPNGGPANKIDAGQPMCRPEQTLQKQTAGSPRLKVAPGQGIALRYQENGHVTLLQNNPGKASGSGTNFVYLTTDSKPDDKFLQIHRQWTPDGNGGDRRGRLISTRNFDDGQCYQINGNQKSVQRQQEFSHPPDALQGQALWCQQDVQIPEDIKPGTTVTLYWVWDWPTMPGTPGLLEGKQEIYTTCMDVDVVDPSSLKSDGTNKALQQNPGTPNLANSAVPAQFKNIANPTAVNAQLIPFSGAQSATTSIQSSKTSDSNGSLTQATSTPRLTSSISLPSPSSSSSQTNSPKASSATRSFSLKPFSTQNLETVTVTVTASPTSSRFRIGRPSIVTVTATETDFVTARITQAAATRRDVELDSTGPDTETMTSDTASSDVLEVEVVPTAVSTSTSGCSVTESVYLLRARNPFFILPSHDQPGSSAGAGC